MVKRNFYDDIKNGRLSVSTYPATTYNELLRNNIPTICFWDRNLWQLENKAEKYLDKLMEAKIFHQTMSQQYRT